MRTLLLPVISVCGLICADTGAAASPSPGAIALAPCKLPGLAEPARCGALELPENPDRPDGRRLQIAVAIVPATGQARSDPLVPLMGGPGEAAIGEAAYFAELFAPLRRDHDILLIDQRGSGRSNSLRCDLYSPDDPAASLRNLFPPATVHRCLHQALARADLTQYTYLHFAEDIEHIRHALGYGKMNIFGGSYGTRAGQVLMRTHPHSVRTAYLGSVVPLDVITTLSMARSSQAALEEVFKACAAEPACSTAFPNLRKEFRRLAVRLKSGEVRAAIPGRSGTYQIDYGRVMEWLRAMNYRPTAAASLPWTIHRAYLGDYAPIVEGVLTNARNADAALSFGLFFTITCNDDVAYMREEDVVRETDGTFLGDYRARQQQAACKDWPTVAYPAGYRTPLRSDIPTMFVSGDLDAATPLWMTQRVAPGFSNRLEVVLRGKGHTDLSDCIQALYAQFVRKGDARELDASACRPVARPPFKTG